MKDILLHVEGMECTGCENRIQNALKDIDGVKEVVAKHQDGTVSISMEENCSLDDLKEKLSDLGFPTNE